MLTVLAGEDSTIAVPFIRDGEPFLADDATWSLRGQDGSVILSALEVEDLTDTFATIVIEATHNSVGGGVHFEKRVIIVKGTSAGNPFEVAFPYRVTPYLNMTVRPEDVRTFAGTDSGELPDAEIDLPTAYFDMADLLGTGPLINALSSGLVDERQANDAIKARAFLNVLPGLRQRMSKKEADGNMTIERFKIDFDRLELDAVRLIDLARNTIASYNDTAVSRPLLVLGTPAPDPVTG